MILKSLVGLHFQDNFRTRHLERQIFHDKGTFGFLAFGLGRGSGHGSGRGRGLSRGLFIPLRRTRRRRDVPDVPGLGLARRLGRTIRAGGIGRRVGNLRRRQVRFAVMILNGLGVGELVGVSGRQTSYGGAGLGFGLSDLGRWIGSARTRRRRDKGLDLILGTRVGFRRHHLLKQHKTHGNQHPFPRMACILSRCRARLKSRKPI